MNLIIVSSSPAFGSDNLKQALIALGSWQEPYYFATCGPRQMREAICYGAYFANKHFNPGSATYYGAGYTCKQYLPRYRYAIDPLKYPSYSDYWTEGYEWTNRTQGIIAAERMVQTEHKALGRKYQQVDALWHFGHPINQLTIANTAVSEAQRLNIPVLFHP